MITVDLRADGRYPPLGDKTPNELFELGVEIVTAFENVRVRTPVGDRPEETVVLDSKVLRRRGVQVF